MRLKRGEQVADPALPRAKAERMLATLQRRIQHINVSAEFTGYVRSIVVFGSFLDKHKAVLGDLDVAIDVAVKPSASRDAVTSDWPEWFDGVIRYLKRRQEGLSLCILDDHKAIVRGGMEFRFDAESVAKTISESVV